MKNFRITVRASIVTIITALLLVTGLAVSYISYAGGKKSVYYLAENLISEVSKAVIERVLSRLDAVKSVSQISNYVLSRGHVDTGSQKEVMAYLRTVVERRPEVDSAIFGRPDGNSWIVKRMLDRTISEKTNLTGSIPRATYWKHDNPAYNKAYPVKITGEKADYDCRVRPWYRRAVAAPEGGWTDIYIFASDRNPGVGYSVQLRRRGAKEHFGVFSLSVSFLGISYFLDTVKVGRTGYAFLADGKGEVVAMPLRGYAEIDRLLKDIKAADGKDALGFRTTEESDLPGLKEAHAAWRGGGSVPDRIFSFSAGGKKYLAAFKPFPKEEGINLEVGVVIPEDDLMAAIQRNNRRIWFFSGLMTIAALFGGFALSRTISGPLKELTREVEKVRFLDLGEGRPVVTRITEIEKINSAVSNMKQGLRSFRKYVPADLVARLIKLQKEADLETEKREITAFFSDIADFTSITESMPPERLAADLSVYFEGLTKAVSAGRGTIDKYIGDSIMAFWNAPERTEGHPLLACRAALACRDLLAERRGAGLPGAFVTRIGINTGEAIVGNVGYSERMNYTVMGDTVNLASRLEGLNKVYGTEIIISGATRAAAGAAVAARRLDRVAVKGRAGWVEIFELLSEAGHAGHGEPELAAAYEEGLELYFARDWGKASAAFRRALGLRPGDKASAVMLARCAAFEKAPPPGGWEGVHRFTEK